MTERGILMTPTNYGKCADGSKTQTRRIMKPQPCGFGPIGGLQFQRGVGVYDCKGGKPLFDICPYGTVGDRLYVKEGLAAADNGLGSLSYAYRRDGKAVRVLGAIITWDKSSDKVISPLFMPKWAARLWLEITEVRVERLINISNEDAEAEGCQGREGFDPYEVYAELWDSIHGEGSWNLNPWVWIISFKQVSP